jgi:hypothetical protein
MSAHGFDDITTPTFLTKGYDISEEDLFWAWPNATQALSGYVRTNRANDLSVSPPQSGTEERSALYGDVVGTWQADPNDLEPGFALGGSIYDGCLPKALTEIVGGGDPAAAYRINDYEYLIQGVIYPAIQHVHESEDFLAAESAWATCMTDHGQDVNDASDPPGRTWEPPRPSPAEVGMAVADAACKTSTGLSDVGDLLFGNQVSAWLQENPDQPTDIEAYVVAVIERSAAALGESAPGAGSSGG